MGRVDGIDEMNGICFVMNFEMGWDYSGKLN